MDLFAPYSYDILACWNNIGVSNITNATINSCARQCLILGSPLCTIIWFDGSMNTCWYENQNNEYSPLLQPVCGGNAIAYYARSIIAIVKRLTRYIYNYI